MRSLQQAVLNRSLSLKDKNSNMIFIIFCVIVIIVLLTAFLNTLKPIGYPPGPKFLPVVGNYKLFHDRLRFLQYYHLVFEEFSKKYGDVVGLKFGGNLVVAVFGSKAVNEVLTRDEFNGRPNGYFFRMRTFGKRLGLVFSDGNLWQRQRKFSIQHLRHFGMGRRDMEDKIQKEIKELLNFFQKNCEKPMLMHCIFDVSVLNVLWAMITGERFDLEDVRLKKLLAAIHDAFKLVDMTGGVLNQMPILRFIAPEASGYNKNMEVLNYLWSFLKETIEEHKRSVGEIIDARDLVDAFLQKMAVENDPTFTDDQLMSICVDLFMAGSETTSNTLNFLCLYMLLYPAVQKKVQEEIDDVVGRNRSPELRDRPNLKYTEAVLMEIQRRTNIAPLGIAHRATEDTKLFEYRIPKDTMILTSLYSVHMDHLHWKDPHKFRPERFLDEQGNVIIDEKNFIPFGLGKRRCIGEALGKSNIFLFFTGILQNFTLTKSSERPFPELDGYNGFTLSPKPFKAILVPRNE